ncbi:MAG: DUF3617 domain-containing protein [Aquabacterium sp.]|nr:DUF3617 domain-containing protein [Aquabacterium sp.]
MCTSRRSSFTAHRVAVSLALTVSLNIAAHAADTPPIKPGLWQVTADSQQLNGKPLPDMSAQLAEQMKRMPPEMRNQMEAQMKARGVQMAPGGGNMGIRMCLTREMLDENRWQKTEGNCKNTSMTHQGNTWSWKFSCTQPVSEGEGSTTFTDSTSYSSNIRITSQRNGQPQTVTMKHHAKWLGADCGDLKPMAPPPKP